MSFEQHKQDIAYAAITRHMEDNLYHGSAESGFRHSLYNLGEDVYPVTAGDQGEVTLTMAGDNAGSYHHTFNPYQEVYKPWIDKIESAFRNWHPETDLAEPSEFTPLINRMHDAVWRLTLTPGGEGKGGENIGNAGIATSIDYVGKWVQPGSPGAFDGAALRAFDDAYGASRMRLVTGNQRELMIVLGMALAGEQKLWTQIRDDLSTIVYGAKAAFADNGDPKEALKVLLSIIGLAGTFASAGTEAAFGVIDKAGGVVDAVTPSEEGANELGSEMQGNTAEDVYDNMVACLEKLAQGAYDTEVKLNKMLTDAVDLAVRPSRRESFHIHPEGGLDPDFVSAGDIDIEADLTVYREIGYREMPEIAAEMLRSTNAAQAARDLGPWLRSYAIGYGTSGPFPAWSDLYDVVTSITASSANEIVLAGEKLAHYAGFLEDSDGWSREALRGLGKDLKDAGTGWKIEDSTPPPPPRPRGGVPLPY